MAHAYISQSAVASSIDQGSVPGPTLFYLYVNDLPRESCPNCSIEQFADDIQASKQTFTPDDRVILQKSLDTLYIKAEKHMISIYRSTNAFICKSAIVTIL